MIYVTDTYPLMGLSEFLIASSQENIFAISTARRGSTQRRRWSFCFRIGPSIQCSP
jgi:hypothetical protein